ncbi:MAG: methyl-accepting chemotaxis protein [Candidatus Hermodarchaeota archaeon]
MPISIEYLILIIICVPSIIFGILAVIYKKYKISTPFVVASGNMIIGMMVYIATLITAMLDFGIIVFTLVPVVLIVLAGTISWQIRYIRQPLRLLTAQTQTVAEGDLTLKVEKTNRKDEFGILLNGFTSMYISLRETLKRTSKVAEYLTSSAQEIASSTEEVNASSEEISSINQQIARGTQEQAQQISTAVSQTGNLKKQFDQQFQGIKMAADLIESISGQVNMLALNASIEAARAGEYGRGFAVVADNIRRLAEGTKDSLKEINQIIETLQRSITHEINTITILFQNAASISEETAAGAEETGAATEEQVATIQEIAASTQELAKFAVDLEELVKHFKLPEN